MAWNWTTTLLPGPSTVDSVYAQDAQYCTSKFQEEVDALERLGVPFCAPRHERLPEAPVICFPPAGGGQVVTGDCPQLEHFRPGQHFTWECFSNGTWAAKGSLANCVSPEIMCIIDKNCEYLSTSSSAAPNITSSTAGEMFNSSNTGLLTADEFAIHRTVAYIYLVGSIISLIMLVASLAIFCFFKSLRCARVHIHKNLIVSFILRCVLTIILFEPLCRPLNSDGSLSDLTETSFYGVEWLSRLIEMAWVFSVLASMYWTVVEGLFLYSRTTSAVFNSDTPYLLFYSIGWAFPLFLTVVYTICLVILNKEACWMDVWACDGYSWIIVAPIYIAVVINFCFLIIIIYVLVQKLSSANNISPENRRFKKAIKATIILMPLLSVTYLLFAYRTPSVAPDPYFMATYQIFNSVVQVTQGMFVSLFFCFMNGEVGAALARRWKRLQRRDILPHVRTSRTSSVCTQTEHLSNLLGQERRGSGLHQERRGSHPPLVGLAACAGETTSISSRRAEAGSSDTASDKVSFQSPSLGRKEDLTHV